MAAVVKAPAGWVVAAVEGQAVAEAVGRARVRGLQTSYGFGT